MASSLLDDIYEGRVQLEDLTDDELEQYEIELLREEVSEKAHDDLLAYVEYIHPTWDKPMWFHEELARELQEWLDAEDDYILLVTLPPGHAKSSYVTSCCAWALGRDPTRGVAYVSYNTEKAETLGSQTIDQIADPRWRDVFGNVYLPRNAPQKPERAKDTQKTVHIVDEEGKKTGGSFTMVGWQSGLTSARLDIIVMDDLLSGDPSEARSVQRHRDLWTFLHRVVLTRDKYKSPTRAMIIATRWFLDDLTGQVLKKVSPNRFRHVHFEALRDKVDHPLDPREHGEALWPQVRPKKKLEEKRDLDPAGFAALEQGDPVPEGGDIIKPSWIKYYEVLPAGPGTYYQSWDTKHGSTEHSSAECVGQLWFVPDSERVAYWVDEVAGIWDVPDTLAEFDRLQSTRPWNLASQIFIEMKGDGVTVVQTRRDRVPGIIVVNPKGEKTDRLRRVSGFYQSGNVRYPDLATHPDKAEKVLAHIGQITTFSVSALKDKGDAASQFLEKIWLSESPLTEDEQEQWEEDLLSHFGF